jgi:hypothetical protein
MTMNIIHKNCGNTVYQDLSKIIKILGTFGIGTKSTKMTQAYLQMEKNGQMPITYYCANCKKDTSFDEILGICGWCGHQFSVIELFRQINSEGKPVGDIGCKGCIDKYEVVYSNLIPLTEILSKIYIGS